MAITGECPQCGNVMESGEIYGSEGGVRFRAAGQWFGEAITSGWFFQQAVGYRCPVCGTVLIPGDPAYVDTAPPPAPPQMQAPAVEPPPPPGQWQTYQPPGATP